MWNNMLVHFSRNKFSQPPHVTHEHQKCLHIDFIHLLKILMDFFLAAFHIFSQMFLETWKNIWNELKSFTIMFEHFSLLPKSNSKTSFFILYWKEPIKCEYSLLSWPVKRFWRMLLILESSKEQTQDKQDKSKLSCWS